MGLVEVYVEEVSVSLKAHAPPKTPAGPSANAEQLIRALVPEACLPAGQSAGH
jgi:hypothetical protein